VKSFIYVLFESSEQRGYNKHVAVYRIKKNVPVLVGTGDYQSASWCGESAEAVKILMEHKEVPQGDHYKRPEGYLLNQV